MTPEDAKKAKPRNALFKDVLTPALLGGLQEFFRGMLPKSIEISDKLRADINIAFCESCIIDEQQKQDPANMTLEEIVKDCKKCEIEKFIDHLLELLGGERG